MNTLPKCNSEFTYKDDTFFVCPECLYEWTNDEDEKTPENTLIIKDANVTHFRMVTRSPS